MVDIVDKDGVVTLVAEDYELKIDKSRTIYVKPKNKNSFTSIGHEIPPGLSSEEKKRVLYELYTRIEAKRREQSQ
jgi:hypothetical protein